MSKYTLAKGIKPVFICMSMAATWVWAPAIFVASGITSQWGIEGFLWFFIPNVLSLILFGYVASKVPQNIQAYTAGLAIKNFNQNQAKLHNLISLILALCSTFVQLLGIYLVANMWGDIPRIWAGLAIFAVSFVFIISGLKGCIKSDVLKYLILLIGAGFLFFLSEPYQITDSIIRLPNYSSLNCALIFGIPTAIGLLSAPYADTTFWQRAEAFGRDNLKKLFLMSALLFALVPLIFGLIGIFLPIGMEITQIPDFAFKCILTIVVLSALISTIDSNLCAIAAILNGNMRIILLTSLVLLGFFCIFTKLTIVDMFLFYGTLRAVVAMPTVLILFNRANKKRLFQATLFASIACPLGYALFKFIGLDQYAVIFTALTLIIPMYGYSLNSSLR